MTRKTLLYLLVGISFMSLSMWGIGGMVFSQFAGKDLHPEPTLDIPIPPTSTNTSESTTSDSETTPTKTKDKNNSTTTRKCGDPCDGIKLNTCFPIIGDCIETKAEATNPTNAFPTMLRALTKIIMSLILVVCFILVIVAGIMRAGAGENTSKTKKAKDLIIKVAITILLLGFSGVILKLVNPNFFS